MPMVDLAADNGEIIACTRAVQASRDSSVGARGEQCLHHHVAHSFRAHPRNTQNFLSPVARSDRQYRQPQLVTLSTSEIYSPDYAARLAAAATPRPQQLKTVNPAMTAAVRMKPQQDDQHPQPQKQNQPSELSGSAVGAASKQESVVSRLFGNSSKSSSAAPSTAQSAHQADCAPSVTPCSCGCSDLHRQLPDGLGSSAAAWWRALGDSYGLVFEQFFRLVDENS